MDGFTRDADARPAKRRRVEMVVPDGFLQSTNAPPKPVHKPSVPQFASAFGDVDTAPPAKPKAKDPAPMKSMTKKPLSYRLQDTSNSRDPVKASSSRRVVDAHPAPALRPPKIVSVQDIHKELTLDIPPKPRPQLRPAPPPPPLAGPSKAPLRQIAVPVFPEAKAPSKTLQPLQVPANPVLTTSRNNNHFPPGKDLRTLSTAGLGILTDLSSEYGAEDLASILLRDQNKRLYAQVADDPIRRGLELSPEKKGKDGAGKFVRGGLAARASTYFDRTRTAFILWRRQKELERLRANTVPSGADFCASVLKVLYRSPSPTGPSRPSASSSPVTVIALCRIYAPNGNAHALFKADRLYKIVLSCSGGQASELGLEGMDEGQTVRVYKPWYEMGASEEKLEGASANASRLPASLPLPRSQPLPTPDPLDAPMSNTTLFCSRYFIS